ncbi:DNA cytosine methyltransferase [Hydrogenophaga crocea]|uniref:Cytosine-specific methyltransferase n=1 Tax=Hydrogenophaga crocea TaxID=2716225 RepID=A0A6G8IIG4_9BURK|nr:DNA (cytosine-5-)-methyltransferase [Hydrogenophaga crocea]QIM52838.1 DNA (cytosine-5-)-methyltransferase [Hydrogenophaga crocea]
MQEKFRFIDLFAGLGGFHVALRHLGGECVFAAEWKAHLQDLYEVNHGLRPVGDITKVSAKDIPEHDVLTAGFPCQPFSKAGEQKGFECTSQGGLFFNVEDILRAKRPRFFILENVPNLLKHDGGRTLQEIERRLRNLNYHVEFTKLSPHQFGIPQIRERVYIVGSLDPLDSFEWPATSNEPTSIEDVLDAMPDDAKRLSPQVADCLEVWNDFLRRVPADVELPSFPLWSMEWGADYPYENETPRRAFLRGGKRALAGMHGSHGVKLGTFASEEERFAALPSHARDQLVFPKWKQDFIRQNRQFYADNRKWIDPWLKQVLRFPSSLQKFEWNVKGGARNIYDYVIQFRASGVRIKRRNTAPSLIAMTDTQVPIIGWQKRYMTPKECARLQCLSELNSLPESQTRAFHALGNAVNSRVVEMVAEALIKSGRAPKRAPKTRVTKEEVAEAC